MPLSGNITILPKGEENQMSGKTRKTAELSVFTAVAFIFSYIESLFPLPIPFPGIKLGLANLIILVVLCRNGLGAAFGVSMTRNVLNALTFGSLFGLFYSLAGSILSLLFMAALLPGKDSPKKRVKKGWLKIAALQESRCEFIRYRDILLRAKRTFLYAKKDTSRRFTPVVVCPFLRCPSIC